MRFDNQSSSLQLLKLAFGSTKFNPRRVLTTLLLILLFTTGSLYITKQIYQHQKLKSSLVDKTRPEEDIESAQGVKKQAVSASKFSVSPQVLSELRQLRRENRSRKIKQLKFQLQASALGKSKRSTKWNRGWLGEDETEKLARHESILGHADELAKLQLQDQQLYSEDYLYSSIPDEEEPPPPPKQQPGLWSELKKDLLSTLKELIRKFI